MGRVLSPSARCACCPALQNLARSGQACAEHLGIGGARDCAETATVATLEQQAEEWVIELGPLGQTGSVVNEYYIRSKVGLWVRLLGTLCC